MVHLVAGVLGELDFHPKLVQVEHFDATSCEEKLVSEWIGEGVTMARRVSHEGAECPVARAVDVVGDRWSLLIVRDAFDGITRFGDFQRSLGLAKNILASRLRTWSPPASSRSCPPPTAALTTSTRSPRRAANCSASSSHSGNGARTTSSPTASPTPSSSTRTTSAPWPRLQVIDADGRPLKPTDTFVRKVSH